MLLTNILLMLTVFLFSDADHTSVLIIAAALSLDVLLLLLMLTAYFVYTRKIDLDWFLSLHTYSHHEHILAVSFCMN